MNLSPLDWHTLWINATRYAMPRQTYASAEMAEIVEKNAEYIESNTREILIREIERELAQEAVDPLAAEQWQQALEKLKEQP